MQSAEHVADLARGANVVQGIRTAGINGKTSVIRLE